MTDEFEKWMKEYGSDVYYRIGDMQAAYSAGASAMREKCIKVCKDHAQDNWDHEGGALSCAEAIERVEI